MLIHIVLFRGKGFISTCIRWQAGMGAKYSHAALLIQGCLFESWQGVGVRMKRNWAKPDDGTVDLYELEVTAEQAGRMQNFLLLQLGKRYSYLGCIRFLTRRDRDERNAWFCSELVVAACHHAGVMLFKNTKPWEVNPDTLKRSLALNKSNDP